MFTFTSPKGINPLQIADKMKTILESLKKQLEKVNQELIKVEQKYNAMEMPGIKLSNQKYALNKVEMNLKDAIFELEQLMD